MRRSWWPPPPSHFSPQFGGDVRGRQVKSEGARHRVTTIFIDVLIVAHLQITPSVPVMTTQSEILSERWPPPKIFHNQNPNY